MSTVRIATIILLGSLCGGPALACGKERAPGGGVPAAWRELMDASLGGKHGLEFHLGGQVIPGVVTAIGEDGTVEVRNQARDRIVIRLDRVDAIGR